MMNLKLDLAALLLLPAVVSAQDIILWRATNNTSATVVPAYAGQASPFPIETENAEQTSTTLSAEAIEAQRARQSALEVAEKILASKNALRPELGPLQVDGRVEGTNGTKILISNQWVGVGRKLSVRLSRSPEAAAAIAELRKYDSEAAAELEGRLEQRLQQKPFLELTIVSIDARQVNLTGDYGSHAIIIPQTQF